ncbi:AAA family ATPase [Vibrio coralliilyticus]|uniref:AAA family ATPase n=1 Tax=Vibrio coralliilyticus TaxID=190893 RepID=UPI0003189DCF|nr:AAA family ATPase [Vibrio coralliilyticus]
MTKTIEEYKADISYVIDRVKLYGSAEFVFNSGEGEWSLSGVQKFNFFVGANNSGKSRVLRNVLDKSRTWSIDSDLMSVRQLMEDIDLDDMQHLRFKYVNNRDALRSAITQAKEFSPVVSIDKIYTKIAEIAYKKNTVAGDNIESKVQELMSSYIDSKNLELLTDISVNKYADPVYIPTLRTLRHISDTDHYKDRTIQDYFGASKGDDLSSIVFTGHDIGEDLKRHLLGSHKERERVRQFEQFLSEQFFYGADIALTPRINDNVVWFKEGDKEEYPIYDLGDGIQAIIILTYKVFMAEKPTIFFIEEPEKYLHAGMQRTLIEALASIPHHMFFMTTHSNHFLDLALERDDVATHQVSQHEGKTLTCSATELNDLLDELGVRASSVLLANCSIWVEGVTDKLYLRAYMTKFLKELEAKGSEPERVDRLKSHLENLHYVFVEYQGSNITHWAFNHDEADLEKTSAYLLSNKIFLLADGDIGWKGERTENLSTHLGEQFHQLELKEIENYIPLDVIKRTAELRLKSMKKSKECTLNFESFSQKTYAMKTFGIGHYLEKCIEKPKGLEKSFFEETAKSKTGTIRDKVNFCKEAVRYMNGHPDDWKLTEELSDLCDKLWRHIECSNQLNVKSE